jgi:hypothetical protein
MSKSNLQLCPNFKEGRMQPAGKAEFLGETEEPFREINEVRRYECDNCGISSIIQTLPKRLEISKGVPGFDRLS